MISETAPYPSWAQSPARDRRFDDIRHVLDTEGFVVFEPEDHFYTDAEWTEMEHHGLERDLPWETIHIGDAGEPNSVDVGRLMTDVDEPRVVNPDFSLPILDILGAPEKMTFYRSLLGTDALTIRRAQINMMKRDSFIGLHVDQDSNPDYQIAIVLQFGHWFEGGEFVVHLKNGRERVLHPSYRTVTITRCDLAHEVRPVIDGRRTTLVHFVSENEGQNPRHLAGETMQSR